MDRRHPEHRFVTQTMRAAVKEGIILNVAAFIEVAHYFRALGEPEFSSGMDELRSLRTLTLVELDLATADQALSFLAQYGKVGIGGRNAVILATMKLHSVKRILTHDGDFTKVKEIRVVDPIPERL